MGQLFQLILDHLYKIWPVRIVDADEQALRFKFGKHTALLMPGVHWFVPGLMKIEKFNVVYQEIDCEVQSMETADGIAITFSANMGYVIKNVVQYRLGLCHADSTMERRLRGILGEMVEESAFSDLRKTRRKLADRAKKEMTKQSSEWGVDILRVALTDFTRSKNLRVFGISAFN